MIKQKQLVPKRRFEGFTDDWEKCEVSEIGNTYFGGGTPKTSKLEYWGGNIPWIQSSDINEDVFSVSKQKKYITDLGLKKSATQLIPADSLAIVTRVGVGKLALMPYEYSTSQDFFSISNLNIDSYFGVYMMYKLLQNKKNAVQGTSIKGITKNELLSMKMWITNNTKEQQKIGEFFKHLDKMIALEQRKIDKTKALKSAYLAEMFPTEGERVPKRRFAGFAEEWIQCKLGDLGSVAMNKRIFKSQTSEIGDVPFYKIGTFGKEPDTFISRKLFEEYKTNYEYPKKGDILISASGSIGRTVEYSGEDEYFQDSNIVWLKHQGKLDNLFLKQFYKIVRWEGLEGSTIKRLYNKNILNTEIKTPLLKEQKKIGNFFKHLDEIIATHEEKREKLKATKQAYLHEMFV